MAQSVQAPEGSAPHPEDAGTLARDVATLVEEVRSRSPLVHCITNVVVANTTANVLLAAGAAPAMVDAPEECGVLAGVAGALLVNLGTVTRAQAYGIEVAVRAATDAGVPWVLDPVAIGALPMRTDLARDLCRRRPAIIRGNASEIGALTGGAGGRGVDSTQSPDEVAAAAAEVATAFGTVVAVSGEVDLVTDGERVVRVASGTPLLTRVTGVGCSLGALMGAFRAVTDDSLLAAVAATSLMTVAGEQAAAGAPGPGSFAVALVDRLALVDPEQVAAGAGLRLGAGAGR